MDQSHEKIIDQPEVESKTEKENPQETDLQRDASKMEVDGESCLLVDIPLSQYEAGFDKKIRFSDRVRFMRQSFKTWKSS